jgi:hypothetical protein
MPTVLREDGFSIMIYVRDHDPMHVHVFKSGNEVVILIGDITVRKSHGMKLKDVHKAQDLVATHQEFLLNEWKRLSSY